jgi:hypothetical protein
MPRSGIAGSYSSSFLVCWGTSILISIAAALIYISTNNVYGFFLQPPSSAAFVAVHLTWMRWNLSVLFICISSMTKSVKHLFVYLLAICTSFEKCLFNSRPSSKSTVRQWCPDFRTL